MYTMCDVDNAKEIVAELLTYLDTADYAIRDELVRRVSSVRCPW